ncbi:MAG: arginine N-succinyltransferase [Planctomycetota bacterium]
MFVVRQAVIEDAATLLKLARLVHSNNLPPDADAIRARIIRSQDSFSGRLVDSPDRLFVFVVEDTETGHVIGSSLIAPQVGTPERPHLFLTARKREFYSTDLQTGQVHMTVQLCSDTEGHTEIGGLILTPSYRHHRAKLGFLLSMIRFNFIGLHRDEFCQRIAAEMMGTLTPDSRNTLWTYLGRRFINLSYTEADRFCQHSKEFILSLFPPEEIYVSLLPPDARALIGRVGADTEPALAMLKRLGFSYCNHVDPFDGGPYLEAQLEDISLIRETRSVSLADPSPEYPLDGFVSFEGVAGFRGVRTKYAEISGGVAIPDEAAGLLRVQIGDTIGLTPLAGLRRSPSPATVTGGANS